MLDFGRALPGRALYCDEDISAAIPYANSQVTDTLDLTSFVRHGQGTHLRALTVTDEDGRNKSDGLPRQSKSNMDGFAAEEFVFGTLPLRSKSGSGVVARLFFFKKASFRGLPSKSAWMNSI